MSYIALARKYRPQKISQVIGQELVTTALRNAISTQKLHPVYLLTGTRGVGKTTLARIIAKSINCENLQDNEPCLVCDTCKMIQDGCYADLYEIDAASKTKVEDTREVLDQIAYMPQYGKKKVYLIDEVHMLSQHSFNALLKTLEEPPSHVQFVLATTEPNKIPTTVLSRCLHFNLQPLTESQISTHLAHTLEQENIAFEEEALAHIAQAAQGSMRDALTLLDQSIALSPGKIDSHATQKLVSTLPKSNIISLLRSIKDGDVDAIESICATCEDNNIDFYHLLKDVAHELYAISLAQLMPSRPHELQDIWPATYLQVLYRMAIGGMNDLAHSPTARIGATMCFIRMAVFYPASVQTGQPIAEPAKKKAQS